MAQTLRGSLIRLMSLFFIFFISAFSGIYLKGQLDLTAEHNSYRARLGGFITKEIMGDRLAKYPTIQSDNAISIFKITMAPLVESGLVKKAVLFSQAEKVLSYAGEYDEALYVLKPFVLIGASSVPSTSAKPLLTIADAKTRKVHVVIRFSVNPGYYVVLEYPLGTWREAWEKIKNPIFITAGVICFMMLVLGAMLSGAVISPIKRINQVTKQVAAGNLDMSLEVETDNELGELSNTFNEMTRQLVEMKRKAEDMNPLTKLPGNLVIMQEVENRIHHQGIFFVIYADLNNFKAFNDKYGIFAGDQAIKMTADILQQAVIAEGNPEDLVGHEGGDDFVVITTPDKAEAIAKTVMESFDAQTKSFYVPGDIEKGFFTALGRDEQIHQFPLMGIALAGVTNAHRKIGSYAEMTSICTEVKRKAKSFVKSAFWMDARHT